MSNTLAIACVTSTVRYLLDQALGGTQPGPVGSANVTTLHPAQLAAVDGGDAPKAINVFLYRVTPNHAWNLTDLPTRRQDGTLACRPVAALDLHYLLSCSGDDAELDAQRLLARAVLALAVTPVLGRDVVAQAIEEYGADTPTSFLSAADLADQVELVKISPATLSVEDMSRLWGALGTPYLLSVTYVATVVLIEADLFPQPVLPVRERVVEVAPIDPPTITEVETDPQGEPVVSGSELLVEGSGLRGPVTIVQLGSAELIPSEQATAALVRVVVSETVPAGVHGLQVVHRSPAGSGGEPTRIVARSNAKPVLVRPDVAATDATATEVTITVVPPLFPGQRVAVNLAPLGPADSRTPLTYSLTPVATGADPASDIVLDRASVPDGDWLIRLVVDGADSLPRMVGDTYGKPLLSLE